MKLKGKCEVKLEVRDSLNPTIPVEEQSAGKCYRHAPVLQQTGAEPVAVGCEAGRQSLLRLGGFLSFRLGVKIPFLPICGQRARSLN